MNIKKIFDTLKSPYEAQNIPNDAELSETSPGIRRVDNDGCSRTEVSSNFKKCEFLRLVVTQPSFTCVIPMNIVLKLIVATTMKPNQ